MRREGQDLEKGKRPEFDRKIRPSTLIIICIVLIMLSAGATYFFIMHDFGSKHYLDDAKKYVEIEKIISEKYIGETEPQSLFDAAAAAMVNSIGDNWSYYMSPEQYEAYKLTSSNEYAGIGASVKENDSGDFEISDVQEGTPAHTAGLKPGQIILSVDGESVEGKTLEEVSTLIRSKLNKDFDVLIKDTNGDELSVTLACEIIFRNPVSSRIIDGHVGYVKISNFEAGSSESTINAIEKLITAGADSFIFDVRNNPGGLLSELVDLLDYILPEGDIFVSIDRNGKETVSTSDKISLSNKMVVIVNANTYSAAEFFAAALQEYDWATIVGEHTTGKARSQVTIELSDGGAVHISTHKYLTPERTDLSETGGIAPDIAVTKGATEGDSSLDAAIKALG